MRFYARFCDDLILTATPGSLPIASKKVRVIGHGIDTELFKPDGTATRDLVSVGRVSPIKGLHEMVEALAVCRDRLGAEYTLDLVGPCSSAHGAYRERVLRRVKELGLDEQIRFLGPRNFTSLPTLLASYRATLNFSSTALDKSVLESMAVGVPVVSTNPCVAEVLPEALTGQLVAPIGDSLTQAQRIRGVLSLSTTDRAELGKALRAIVVSDHALSGHMGRALDEIAKLVVSRRKRLGPSMSGPRSDRVSDAGPAPPR